MSEDTQKKCFHLFLDTAMVKEINELKETNESFFDFIRTAILDKVIKERIKIKEKEMRE